MLSPFSASVKPEARSWDSTCQPEYSFILSSTLSRLMETPRGRTSTVITYYRLIFVNYTLVFQIISYRLKHFAKVILFQRSSFSNIVHSVSNTVQNNVRQHAFLKRSISFKGTFCVFCPIPKVNPSATLDRKAGSLVVGAAINIPWCCPG